MPLNAKGTQIKAAFEKEYGKEEGERNFYATVNAGKITGIDALADATEKLCARFDSFADECRKDDHRVIGGVKLGIADADEPDDDYVRNWYHQAKDMGVAAHDLAAAIDRKSNREKIRALQELLKKKRERNDAAAGETYRDIRRRAEKLGIEAEVENAGVIITIIKDGRYDGTRKVQTMAEFDALLRREKLGR